MGNYRVEETEWIKNHPEQHVFENSGMSMVW